jgi:tetratricopeptide (TPR) repeat protein
VIRVAGIVAIASATLALASGCTSESKPGTSAPSRQSAAALPAVGLPEVSRMDPAVQAQMTTQFRALSSLIENHSAPPRDLAKAYGDMGNLLLAAEYNDAAEPFYLHAEALAPDEMRWPYYLGHVYMGNAEPEKAIAAFERALRLSPNDVAALVWLGNVYLDEGNPEQAEPRFTQALSIQPRVAAALFGLGRAALARRDYARAVDMLEQLLAADPRASMAHYPLALAYRGLGDTERAEAHLRQQGGVEIGPPDPLMVELRGLLHGAVAEENRGIRALDTGDYPAAVAAFRKGLEVAPDNPTLRHKLGTALSLAGDTRGAVEQFEETVRRSPNFAQAHYSLGVLLAANGRYAEAADQLSAAVRSEPNYVEARLQLGELLGRTGRFEQALTQYKQVLAIDPRVADARFGYAGALVGLRRYQEARDVLSEGAKLFPDQPRFAEGLARMDGRR